MTGRTVDEPPAEHGYSPPRFGTIPVLRENAWLSSRRLPRAIGITKVPQPVGPKLPQAESKSLRIVPLQLPRETFLKSRPKSLESEPLQRLRQGSERLQLISLLIGSFPLVLLPRVPPILPFSYSWSGLVASAEFDPFARTRDPNNSSRQDT